MISLISPFLSPGPAASIAFSCSGFITVRILTIVVILDNGHKLYYGTLAIGRGFFVLGRRRVDLIPNLLLGVEIENLKPTPNDVH